MIKVYYPVICAAKKSGILRAIAKGVAINSDLGGGSQNIYENNEILRICETFFSLIFLSIQYHSFQKYYY